MDAQSDYDMRWYVVKTKPKQEVRAVLNLTEWGVESFTPRIRANGGHRGGHQASPMFPGYAFARFDVGTSLSRIRFTRGVQGVVGFGEPATPVDDAVVETIRHRLDEDGTAAPNELKPGDTVEIVEGPLRSIRAVFDKELSGRQRTLVLLTAIGASAAIQIDKSFVRQLESA